MRKLASVVRISSCEPIPETDRLSVTMMENKGWKVVTSRDEFKRGDLAIYFEIDALLPADDDRYAFLRDRCLKKFVSKSGNILDQGLRIKTVKLRGVLSQGLLMPLDKFPEVENRITIHEDPADDELHLPTESGVDEYIPLLDADVTGLLHVRHHDEVKEALAPVDNHAVGGDAYGPFPSAFIPKTDEERIQNLGKFFTTQKGRLFEVTEKNDGASVTMAYSPMVDEANPFAVCSRNIRLKPEMRNGSIPLAWQTAAKYDVEAKLRAYTSETGCELALQGENVGPGVNGNRDKYQEHEWHIFKIWDITHQKFLLPDEARAVCAKLGLTYVPVIAERLAVFDQYPDMDSLLKFAEGKTAAGNEREGLVFKSVDEPYTTFKAVSNRYLLKLG